MCLARPGRRAAGNQSRRRDVGPGEVVADKQQRVPRRDGSRISQAIAEVQPRRMPSAPESKERLDGERPLRLAERHDVHAEFSEQALHLFGRRNTPAPGDHQAGLDDGGGRHTCPVGFQDSIHQVQVSVLFEEDGDEGGRVDGHTPAGP